MLALPHRQKLQAPAGRSPVSTITGRHGSHGGMEQVITRRQAMSTALAGIAATASARAKSPLGAAIIGTAHSHALGHLDAIRESENYRFVAAAEPDPRLLEKAHADSRWNGVRWTSVDEILGSEEIDMVCVETDPLDALPYSLACVLAGKHTKIDKPPGVNLDLLRRIYREARDREVVVQIGYVYRYNPAFRLAHRAIESGWLGPVRSVLCQMNDMQTPESRKRLDRYPGGQMYEICCHMIDALIWLMGEPLRVSTVLRQTMPQQDAMEDDVVATFEFDPAIATVKSHTRNGERYFYVFGERGSIQIDDPDRPKVRLSLSEANADFPVGTSAVPVGPSRRYLPDLDDLAEAIREHRWVEHFTPEHDLAVQRALLQACGMGV